MPRFFVPAEQRPSQGTTRTFLIRTAVSPAAVTAAVRETIDRSDRALSIGAIESLEERMAPLTAEERMGARLAAIFATVALALAAIGLYGVLSHGVARRTGEIGLRIALGAPARNVVALILRESTAPLVVGVALGGALVLLGSSLIASRLYGVAPYDPLTLIAATALLLVVATAAAYLPARRAAHLDPVAALRQN